MRCFLLAALPLAATGCQLIEQPAGMLPRWTAAYREVISEPDRGRLSEWRSAFVKGVAAARRSGHGAEVDREGALLYPDAALTHPEIPDGLYRCRVIKLGAKGPANLDYIAYPAFRCEVRADHQVQQLAKLTGSQRQVGLIFPGDALRNVFLGTLALGDETRVLQYGQDEQRNVAGYVERIGPSRWRLIMPRPHFESVIDVLELMPEGASQ